jgi:hypothetical protein
LGVGKPYEVDTRIQDYLNIFCFEKLNRKAEAEELRKSVIDYTGRRRGPSFSNILAIKLLKEKGDQEAVNASVRKMESSSNPVQKWIVATIKNDQTTVSNLEKDFASDTNFLIIKKLLEVTGK